MSEKTDPATTADWSTLFDLLPIGAYRSSADGRQLRANAALVRLNGYATEAEQLASVHNIAVEWYVDPTRRDEFRTLLDTTGQVQGFVSEVRRHRTRERIWISENAHVVRGPDGEVLFYEGTVEEITERVQAQQALIQSDARLRLISDEVPGVVFIVRLVAGGAPQFEFISAGVRDLYGVEPGEVMRDGQTLQRLRHPEDDSRVAAVVNDTAQSAAHFTEEFRIISRDGKVRWVRASSAAIRRDAIESWRCGVIVDITDRQQARTLRAERDQAEAARQAIIGLLSRISHELRTPLNAVLGFSQLLEQDNTLTDRQRHFATQAVNGGRHLLSLVNDVLDLSLAEGGAFSLQPVRIDVLEALLAAQTLLASAAEAAGVAIHLPAEPLPALLADPTRLRQVLVNLLSNAIKYNQRGGTVQVVVAAAPGAGEVVITVQDDGPGINAEWQTRLFQPFERLGAERSAVPGTGLGLALSRQLARAMGGDIELDQGALPGACFRLRLPAA